MQIKQTFPATSYGCITSRISTQKFTVQTFIQSSQSHTNKMVTPIISLGRNQIYTYITTYYIHTRYTIAYGLRSFTVQIFI